MRHLLTSVGSIGVAVASCMLLAAPASATDQFSEVDAVYGVHGAALGGVGDVQAAQGQQRGRCHRWAAHSPSSAREMRLTARTRAATVRPASVDTHQASAR